MSDYARSRLDRPLPKSFDLKNNRTTVIGDFQALVLDAVAHLSKEAYGSKIAEKLTAALERQVHQPQVYTALVKLESMGLVESQISSDHTAGRRGRPRRIFTITAPGLRLLRARERYFKSAHSMETYGSAKKAAPA